MPQKDALSQFETKNKIFSNGCRRLKMSFHLSFLCCQHLQIDCVFASDDAAIYPKKWLTSITQYFFVLLKVNLTFVDLINIFLDAIASLAPTPVSRSITQGLPGPKLFGSDI